MKLKEAEKILKGYKYFPQANFYFESQARMSIAEYVEYYQVNDLKEYLIPNWKQGMDNLYEDFEGSARRKKYHWAAAVSGRYGADAAKEAKLTAVLDGDDGWHDE